MNDDTTNRPMADGGFMLVELLVALVVLTVGILSLGLVAGGINQQVKASDISVERSASLRAAVEEIRATPFEDLASGSVTIDAYAVSWTITASASSYKEVEIVTIGPGMAPGLDGGTRRLLATVADTFVYRLLARPSTQM